MESVHTRQPVSVITTVKNDERGCAQTIQSLLVQTRRPDEIVVVDGGSTDGTLATLRSFAAQHAHLRVIHAPEANIARGRNIATEAARHDIIAATDGGCVAAPDWLEKITAPFDAEDPAEFVAGFYEIDAQSLLESVVGLATMRGQLDPIDRDSFNPSGRSVAYTKTVWSRAGGWPEWVHFSEDTLFDHRVRSLDVTWRVAEDAIVHWRPRRSFRKIAKQFYCYGTGRGHTQIDAPSFHYNLRNAAIVVITALLLIVSPWFAIPLAAQLAYFCVLTFHEKARRIATVTQRRRAYVMALAVMWTVLGANTLGYLVGTLQRLSKPDRYAKRMKAYLAGT